MMMKPTAGKSEHTRDMACQLTQEERELWICGQLSASPPPFSLRVGNMTRCSQRWATHMILRSELTTYPQLPPPPFSWKGGKRTEPLTAVRNSRDPEVGNKMTLDKYDWVLEFDIKGLFDNIDHELLLRAVNKHTECKWVKLYIDRWLKAPMQLADGTLVERSKGTPQGGVVSPVLANLFMHYVFDVWMSRTFSTVPWCRYADDALVHCETEREAQAIKAALAARLAECHLELHAGKTRIVYCKDGSRKGQYPNTRFDFLGYTFRSRVAKNRKRNTLFVNFSPAVSAAALTAMRQKTRRQNFRNRSNLSLEDIARMYNPILRGWLEYYGRFRPSAMYPVLRHFNLTLIAWAMRKYRRLKGRKTRAGLFIEGISKRQPTLFVHWQREMVGVFA